MQKDTRGRKKEEGGKESGDGARVVEEKGLSVIHFPPNIDRCTRRTKPVRESLFTVHEINDLYKLGLKFARIFKDNTCSNQRMTIITGR